MYACQLSFGAQNLLHPGSLIWTLRDNIHKKIAIGKLSNLAFTALPTNPISYNGKV